MVLSREEIEIAVDRALNSPSGPDPIPLSHIPCEYWRSPDHKAAVTKIFKHLNELVPNDRRFSDYDELEEAVPANIYFEPIHDAEIPMGDDFGESLHANVYLQAYDALDVREIVSKEPVDREALRSTLDELVQSFVTLAEEYVPKLATWSREHVNEIPAWFGEEAVKELAFHVFISRWSGMYLE